MLDTGIQPLLCSHLVKIKSSGSQCLGTGMTPFIVTHIYSMIIFLDHLVYLFCHSAERIRHWNPEKRMMSSQCPDTGIQPLSCNFII
ncbi:hypothetical protein [Wolbachia endosymbiont (group A) of Beris morrisii]|uniref:hypothetical protein n=1 Tax=Wolbachia endosymbiont (group A) of Beris morrisii TaxID=3066139 RepID=UPI00333F3635